MKTSSLIIGLAILNVSALASANDVQTEYCAGTVFRETPYADIRCTRRLSKEQAAKSKHFEFDYDAEGWLTEVRHTQAGSLRAYSNRFVRAPRTTIQYKDNYEIRRFYNEWGQRTLVSGGVYETRIRLDAKNRRDELVFYGLDGKSIDNDFRISRYVWKTRADGEVIEHRFNTEGELVRNRPSFGYLVTRFAYDMNGLLTRMYNLGVGGHELMPDDAGIAMTQIRYDRHNQFIQWLNLDMEGQPKWAMSDIAEIIYEPSQFNSEQVAIFNDADGTPQVTGWGAHKVVYEFDKYGNAVSWLHFGIDGNPVNSSSGTGQIKSKWSADGVYLLADSYFDKDGKPIASSYSGVHSIETKIGVNGKSQSITFKDLDGKTLVHKGQGFAVEAFEYDRAGRLTSRNFYGCRKGSSKPRNAGRG